MIYHPSINTDDWERWRLAYEGGESFIDRYLERVSTRETTEDFLTRKKLTYCPAFAKVGINEIRDAIYQRMADITRAGGTKTYRDALTSLNGGIDKEGSSLDYFMGFEVLPELLVMGRVGIYVDMPALLGDSLADNRSIRPYIYKYNCEQIMNWVPDNSANNNEFRSVLLVDTFYDYDDEKLFPIQTKTQYRKIWRDDDGKIYVKQYTDEKKDTDIVRLDIDRIPFIMLTISESLMTDVAKYQIALLNLASTDLNSMKNNFPFYTEQRDPRSSSPHLREDGDGTDTERTIDVGPTKGRTYPLGAERPGFINPSAEPLRVSMEKQEQMKAEIRQLLKLSIANLKGPKSASAESKKQDVQTLESGLSYIGFAMEAAERKIAEYWSMYERSKDIATINYPQNYSLISDEQRKQEAKDLLDVMEQIPSRLYQKAIAKRAVNILLGTKIKHADLLAIEKEIDEAASMCSDPDTIKIDLELGLVSLESASNLRGYPAGEVAKAKQDHAERLARIAAYQTKGMGARGVNDLSENPRQEAAEEKKISRDTTTDDVVRDKTRGEGDG